MASDTDILLIVAAFAAVGVAIAALFVQNSQFKKQLKAAEDLQVKQLENDNRTFRMQGLQLAYEKLNDPDERRARARVLSAFYDYWVGMNKSTPVFDVDAFYNEFIKDGHPGHMDIVEYRPEIKNDTERIKNNFEQIAIMEKNGMIDEQSYFMAYWGSMLRCYGALEGHIKAAQIRTRTKDYTIYYSSQSARAVDYWKQNRKDSQIAYYKSATIIDDSKSEK